MKILRIFKKPVFLVTLVVLAAILSVSVIAATSTGSDFGGTVTKYQVGLQGKVNLKLMLDDATSGGMADEDYYEIAVDDRTEVIQYPVSEIRKTNVILVKLAPTEMSKTVTVTAVKAADGTRGKVQTFSVKGYADAVLASESNADYHDAMRALLNWGAKSETYFLGTGTTTADGLFSRGTDPISAVGEATISFPTQNPMSITGSRFVQVGSELNLLLNEGDVSLVFKFKSTTSDEASLSATIKRNDWAEAQNVSAVKDGNYYVVRINSISTRLFNNTYTVTVKDSANNSVTATSSVLAYLDQIVEGNTKNPTEAQMNVAKSLYQLYQLTADNAKPDSAACAHNSTFWIPSGEKECYKCALCFEQLGKPVGSGVNFYMPAETVSNSGLSGTMTFTTMNEGGVEFARIADISYNTDGWVAFSPITSQIANSGRYLVMKIRIPDNDANHTFLRLYTATDKSKWPDGLTDVKISDDNNWHVIVVDLAERLKDKGCFTESDDGTYDVAHLQIRPALDKLSTIGTVKIDVAYIALMDDAGAIKTLVDEATYEKSVSQTVSVETNTTDNICVNHSLSATVSTDGENGAKVYTYKCIGCGKTLNTMTVPSSVNYFSDLSKMGSYNGTLTKCQYDEVNGVVYNNLKSTSTSGSYINITGGDGGGRATLEVYQPGRYFVMKFRNNSGSIVVIEAGSANNKFGNLGQRQGQSDWQVVVIDMQDIIAAEKYPTADSTLFLRLTMYKVGDTNIDVDIAYAATVDSLDELNGFVTEKTFNYYGTSFGNTPVERSTQTGECVNHSLSAPVITDGENGAKVYTYKCSGCGRELNTMTVPSSVNYFSDLSKMGRYNAILTKCQYDEENGVVYNNLTATAPSFINITGGDGAGSATTETYQPGRYFVMKFRNNSGCNVAIQAGTSSSAWGTLGERKGQSDWQVVVIDMQDIITAGKYPTSESASALFFRLDAYLAGVSSINIDVAYVATVDSFDELKGLVTDETFNYYGTSYSSTPVVYSTQTGEPAAN